MAQRLVNNPVFLVVIPDSFVKRDGVEIINENYLSVDLFDNKVLRVEFAKVSREDDKYVIRDHSKDNEHVASFDCRVWEEIPDLHFEQRSAI